MSWPKRIIAAVFAAAVVTVVFLSLRPKPPPPLKVDVTAVKRGPITRTVTAAGKLLASTEVKVSSNLSGDILELTVREGDAVKRGQLLARIDSQRYAAQVRQQEAARASAAADLDLERVQLSKIEAEQKRIERLVASASASTAELERATADTQSERAKVQAVAQRLAQTDAALSEARHWLELCTINAPIDGIVTSRQKQVGERVRGSDFSEDVIVIVATLSNMEAKVEVGEHEVVYLHVGDKAEIEIDAFPDKKWPAQVIEIARNATIKNPGTEAEVINFPVRLALTTPVTGALPGMSAQASVSTETHDNALMVPVQAVTARLKSELTKEKGAVVADATPPATSATDAQPGPKRDRKMQKLVFVTEAGVAKARQVEVGLANDTDIELTSGVNEGELVVTGPYKVLARDLTDGRTVEVQEPPKKPAPPPPATGPIAGEPR
jgi:HlyD family secretion protein